MLTGRAAQRVRLRCRAGLGVSYRRAAATEPGGNSYRPGGCPRPWGYRIALLLRLSAEGKRTMGRKQNDVFVLGEESLHAEPIATGNPDPVAAEDEREPGGEVSPSPPVRSADSVGGANRRLAVLGLGAAAAATLGALELSGAGPVHPQRSQTSPRWPLIASSAPSAPAPPAHPAPPRPADPKSEPRSRPRRVRRRPRDVRHGKPEREPTQGQAPVGSPAEVSVPPMAPTPAPPPPSPPPPPGGGGSGGRERFGFER